MLELSHFRKPQNYAGNEYNVVKKPHGGKISVCLCYPDVYEVGMSNLGIRILYTLFNRYNDIVCERAFMPGPDLYSYLLKTHQPVFSLESKTSLAQFDVLAFNVSCELTFTNFLAILSASAIELNAIRRRDIIVLGGGAANPEGLSEFVDVFFVGEFEEALPGFIEVLRSVPGKKERLRALSHREGFYVPRFYHIDFSHNRYSCERTYPHARYPLKKVYVKQLCADTAPVPWLVPYTGIIHDRAQIEIARGCPNRCLFCQARCLYFPYRERPPDRVMEVLTKTYESSGYENVSLLALSASNYSRIEALLDEAVAFCRKHNIGISLPSLRVEDITSRLHPLLRRIKKVSATFAVEAATERVRESIGKKIDINALCEAARILKSLGSRHFKLYFMFGFPREQDDDLEAIGAFVRKLSGESRLGIHVSINTLIPKPFSGFQDVPMLGENELVRRRGLILAHFPRNARIKVSVPDIKRSRIEAVISRADRKFCGVLRRAFLRGAVFDAHREHCNVSAWDEAFKETAFDPDEFLARQTENFPWSHISME